MSPLMMRAMCGYLSRRRRDSIAFLWTRLANRDSRAMQSFSVGCRVAVVRPACRFNWRHSFLSLSNPNLLFIFGSLFFRIRMNRLPIACFNDSLMRATSLWPSVIAFDFSRALSTATSMQLFSLLFGLSLPDLNIFWQLVPNSFQECCIKI